MIICYRVIPRKPVHNRSRHSLNIWNNSFWQSWWFLTLMMMHIVQLSARSFYPYVQLRNSFRPPRWYHSKTRSQPSFHREIWSLGLQYSQKHWGCTILADLGTLAKYWLYEFMTYVKYNISNTIFHLFCIYLVRYACKLWNNALVNPIKIPC